MADNSVFLYNLEVGDKFTTTKDRNKVFVITGRKGDTTYVKEVDTGKETWFGIPDAFVVPVNEEAPQQCKDSREPNYMDDPEYGKVQTREIYTESKKLRKSYKFLKKKLNEAYYIKKDKKYFCNMNGSPAWGPIKDLAIPFNSEQEARDYMKKFDYLLDTDKSPIIVKESKKVVEGFMVKQKSGNIYIGRFDSKDKAEKAVKVLAKRRGQSEADWLIEPDDKYMAAETEKGSSSWGPIPMNTLVESVNLSNEDDLYDLKSENITERAIRKAVKEMLGKSDKQDSKFSSDVNEGCIKESYYLKNKEGKYLSQPRPGKYDLTDNKAEAMTFKDGFAAAKENSYVRNFMFDPKKRFAGLETIQEEGEAVAPVTSTANVDNPELPLKLKESLSSKTHKFRPEELKVGKRVIDRIGGREVHGKITVNHHDLYKDNPYRQDGKGSTVVTITTDSGRSYDVDANDNGGEFILENSSIESQVPLWTLKKGQKFRVPYDTNIHKAGEQLFKITYVSNHQVDAIDDKGVPYTWSNPAQTMVIKESSYYIKSPAGFYLYKRKFGYDLTDNKEQALKWDNNRDATHEMRYVKKYSPDIRFRKLDVVQEEGEAPAVANTTSNVANPELPLKLKESILKTQNEGWGFFGTITMEFDHNSYEKAKEAWKIAFVEVQRATGWTDVEVRVWLDSRDGRHFADQCADFGVANDMRDGISQAAKFWKERKWFK